MGGTGPRAESRAAAQRLHDRPVEAWAVGADGHGDGAAAAGSVVGGEVAVDSEGVKTATHLEGGCRAGAGDGGDGAAVLLHLLDAAHPCDKSWGRR